MSSPVTAVPRACLLLLAASFLGSNVPPAASAAGRARVERLDGSVVAVPGPEFSPDRLAGAVWVTFDGFEAPPTAPWLEADRAVLRLVGGDRLLGPVTDGDGDYLELELIGGARPRVLIDSIESLRFPGRLGEEALATLEPASSGDRLYWVRPGGVDRVDGTVESFEEDGVRFEGVLGSKVFPWEEIAALFVETFEESPDGDPADGPASGQGASAPAVVLDLIDGSRLHGRLIGLDESSARLELRGAGTVVLPVPVLAELVPDGGLARFLSAMTPSEVSEGSPFVTGDDGVVDDLGMRWPHRMDRSVTGGPLTCGGVKSSRGIGVHAPSRLVFELDGSYRELRGAVGIDDTVLLLPHRGSVVFRVVVDGSVRWESGLVRGGAAPVEIGPIELEGARQIALEVDMATRFHVADRANWMRMLLVR